MLLPYFTKTLIEAGCDEAGRGSLAGPVVAAAVILPKELATVLNKVNKQTKKWESKRVEFNTRAYSTTNTFSSVSCGIDSLKFFEKVNDSKKLSDAERRELRPLIKKIALTYSIGIASVEEIDKINILNASFLAMHRAIAKLKLKPQLLLIDGNRFKYFTGKDFNSHTIPHKCIIGGDGKYLSIACASILAKTYRDDYMIKLHKKFPQYGWNQNKGYPTLAHRNAIEKYGTIKHHRKSFTLLYSQIKMDFLSY
jgi:ribonuclease HII